MSLPSERRATVRVPFQGQCEVREGDARSQAETINLSLGGALLRFDGPGPSAGSSVKIALPLVGTFPELRLEFEGEVVHRADDTAGVRFDRMPGDSLTHLRALVEMNAGEGYDSSAELARHLATRN